MSSTLVDRVLRYWYSTVRSGVDQREDLAALERVDRVAHVRVTQLEAAFAEAAHHQSVAVATSQRAVDDQAFIDALSHDDE